MIRHDIHFDLPDLYPKQKAALFDPHRYALIEASTKSGKTAGAIIWMLCQALDGNHQGHNFSWTAPVSKQSNDAFARTFNAIRADQRTVNLTEKTVTLPNGAIIWFQGGDEPDYLYGKDVYAAVVDEASRVKEATWHAVRSTLTATQGPVRLIGNVHGRKNWFYKMARVAESGSNPHYAYHKLIAADAVQEGVLTQADIDDAKATYPENVFRELYLAEPSDDEGNPFGYEQIRRCVAEMSNLRPDVWGWDLAKKADWTVGIALDRNGCVCRFERFRGGDWEIITQRILAATQRTAALVDSTGVGDPILERLQKESRNFEGYGFTGVSKQKLMEGLAMAIGRKEITYPEGNIVDELESFEYVYTPTQTRYAAMDGYHDDCVCALALAVMHRLRAKNYDSSMDWVGGPSVGEPWPDGVNPPPTVEPISRAGLIELAKRRRVWYPGVGWR